MTTPLRIQGTIGQIASLLGLNKWQLLEANYNGCSFHTLNAYNSAATSNSIGQAIASGSYIYNQFLGSTNVNNPNVANNLFNTSLSLMNVNDTLTSKYVVKRLPNSNQNSIEPLGFDGWSYEINALFFGADYLSAFNNFLNAWYNPPKNATNVLIHPIYGLIAGKTILTQVKCRYSSDAIQAGAYTFSFISEKSQAWIPQKQDDSAIANIALTSILQSVGALGLGVQLGGILIK